MSCGCKCRYLPLGGANSALPNPLAGFEGPLQYGNKKGKGKGGNEQKEVKGRKRREKHPK